MIRTLTPALFLLTAGGALADPPNAEPDRGLLVLEPSSSRSVFRTDRAASDVELCVTQVNRHAREGEPLLPGDRFAFRLPPECAAFTGGCAVETDSAALLPGDVLCDVGPDAVELTVLTTAPFSAEDAICAVVTVRAGAPTSCALEFRLSPRASASPPHQPHGVHRIANVAQPSFLTWDVVDPLSGPTGSVGNEGPVGAAGPTGSTGVAGPTGAIGVVGVSGPRGATGTTGEPGPGGTAGAAGATGSVGTPGVSGAAGPAGPDGVAGPSGPDGVAGVVGFTGSTGAQGPPGAAGVGAGTDCRKLFYVTRTLHHADEAPTACEAGFHFASQAELSDWTRHRYDTGRGLQAADSGYGPPGFVATSDPYRLPQFFRGWIRTGHDAFGVRHCGSWTSRDPARFGQYVHLSLSTSGDGADWFRDAARCDELLRVWCMED